MSNTAATQEKKGTETMAQTLEMQYRAARRTKMVEML